MKITLTYLSATLLYAVLGFSSCGDSQKEDKPEIDNEILEDPNQSLNTDFNGKVFSIPSPLQTALLIKESKAAYNESLLNDVNNLDKYTSEQRQALNLGIYGTDLGYASLYQQNSTSLKYLAIVEKLTNKLGLEAAFDRNFMTRFEKNSSNQDSMMVIVADAFRKADNFLKSSDRKATSALILTGGWIESLYFACELNRQVQNPKIVERIGEQQQTLRSIIEILKEYNEKGINDALISDMEDLKLSFDKINIEYEFIEPTTNASTKTTTLNHKMAVRIDTNVLNQITLKINSIREKLIN